MQQEIKSPIAAREAGQIKTFKKSHPIGRNFHTGLYGFVRVMGCLNLNRCIYKTKRSAEMARAQQAACQLEF